MITMLRVGFAILATTTLVALVHDTAVGTLSVDSLATGAFLLLSAVIAHRATLIMARG